MKKNSISSVVLLFLSILLFVASQPSKFFLDGLSFCAWLPYIPLFLLCERRLSVKKSFAYGSIYGALSYLLLCPWISNFGFVAILFVCVLFAFYNSILFFLLSFFQKKIPQISRDFFWVIRAILVLFVEFVRTQGIFAFSYGIIGYSQWKNPVFLKFSSLFGVFGVSFVLLLFNSLAAKIISEKNLRANLKKISLLFSLLFSILLYYKMPSFFTPSAVKETLNVSVIQNASSASSRSISEFVRDAENLKILTDSALKEHPETELVVWPETAIVPDILYHFFNDKDEKRHKLSVTLIDYFNGKKCSFLIGNNHIDEDGTHNSALYFSAETKEFEVYNKNHLVPFTEFWPDFLDYKIFDGIKDSLECEFFAHGEGEKIFKLGNLNFSVPICFEDSFPRLFRKSKKIGADFFVNISDDAWAHSEAAQSIHLSMSVFRAAEFSSVIIRSTVDGKTCVVDSEGKVISFMESGIDGSLFTKIEIHGGRRTLYSVFGDLPLILICVFLFIFGTRLHSSFLFQFRNLLKSLCSLCPPKCRRK